MFQREAIVHTNLGITTFGSNKSVIELIDEIQQKYKYQTIVSIKISDRVK